MGQPETISLGASAGGDADAVFDAFFEFVAEFVEFGYEAHGVIVEADLFDE